MRYRPQGYTRAVCPWYLTDSRLTISCAAEIDRAVRRRIEFENPEDKTAYMRNHCFQHCSSCPLRMVMDERNK